MITGEIDKRLGAVISRTEFSRVCLPLFNAAREHPDITAWVLCNDETALEALTFLRSAGTRIPRDLSVAGFDDQVGASFADLTTYNFNTAALARAMLSHVMGCRLPAGQSRKLVEIDGFIVHRGSVGTKH